MNRNKLKYEQKFVFTELRTEKQFIT